MKIYPPIKTRFWHNICCIYCTNISCTDILYNSRNSSFWWKISVLPRRMANILEDANKSLPCLAPWPAYYPFNNYFRQDVSFKFQIPSQKWRLFVMCVIQCHKRVTFGRPVHCISSNRNAVNAQYRAHVLFCRAPFFIWLVFRLKDLTWWQE